MLSNAHVVLNAVGVPADSRAAVYAAAVIAWIAAVVMAVRRERVEPGRFGEAA